MKTQQSPFILTLGSTKTGGEISRDYCDAIRFQNGFCLHENLKPTFSRAFSESSFIRDGLVTDGRPNRKNKAVFSNFSCVVWTEPQRTA